MKNNKKGLSLIVLAITIIVMVILASAIIITINNSRVVDKAEIAASSTNEATMKEAAKSEYAQYNIDTQLGKIDSREVSASEYVKDKLKEQGFNDEQLKLLEVADDGTINVYKYPTIPAGFVVSDLTTEDDVWEGLVIYEGTEKVSTDADAKTTRNQYVWIPVNDINEFVRRDGYVSGKKQSSSGYKELANGTYSGISISATNDLTGEHAEYAAMYESVKKYGGFYVGRYEVGSVEHRAVIEGNRGTTTLVPSRKGVYAYNHVGVSPSLTIVSGDIIDSNGHNQGKGAIELARSIYPKDGTYNVVSTLLYGIQWDAVMHFMKNVQNPDGIKSKYYIVDSTNMGWHANNYLDGNPNIMTGMDVDEKISNKVKNIYDMAGNLWEYTMELYYGSRVIRGGCSLFESANGYRSPASCRGHFGSESKGTSNGGFRIALYLK